MTSKNPTIHVLGPERHAGWACVSPTSALADLIDENKQHVMAYIKPFPLNSRGCFGEISRWTLATSQGISTSPKVWIHLLSPERAREAWPDQIWPDEPTICFASAEINNDIADCQFQTDSPLLIEMLLKWPMLYHTIALDIWLDNIDSHPGNLIWTGENDFVVIDGAECFGGQFWTTAQLENPAYSINKLAALIGAIDDFVPTASAKIKILAASTSHNAAFISCESLLQEWARKLIGPQECHAPLDSLRRGLGLVNTRWNTNALQPTH